jgi:hypothetical protein
LVGGPDDERQGHAGVDLAGGGEGADAEESRDGRQWHAELVGEDVAEDQQLAVPDDELVDLADETSLYK